jgi:hypothetical protein
MNFPLACSASYKTFLFFFSLALLLHSTPAQDVVQFVYSFLSKLKDLIEFALSNAARVIKRSSSFSHLRHFCTQHPHRMWCTLFTAYYPSLRFLLNFPLACSASDKTFLFFFSLAPLLHSTPAQDVVQFVYSGLDKGEPVRTIARNLVCEKLKSLI